MADEIIGFKRDADFDRMRRAILKIENMPSVPVLPPSFNPYEQPGIWVYNTEEEDIPANALMAVEDYEDEYMDTFGQVFAKVGKPDTTLRRMYLPNDELEIPAGDIKFLPFERAYRIAHDTSWAPATGESGGPKPGSWLLWKGYPDICSVIGRADVTNDILLGTLGEIGTLAGKADSNIAAMSGDTPGSGTVSIWYFNGTSYADTTMNVTAYNKSKAAVTANEHITLLLVNGIWEVIFEACGA